MSLVEVAPSTVMQLKVSVTASRRTCWRTAGSAWASVVSTASIVAMFGWSIAAPLAMPPTVKPPPSITTSLRTVSVVRMAWAASPAPSADRAAARPGMAATMGSRGRR